MMYGFIDTNESSTSTYLSLMTSFNGFILDEELTDDGGFFRTLTVSGRGLVNRNIATNDYHGHGSVERSAFLEERLIDVKFQMKDKTNTGFRERFNKLNKLLLGSKKELQFTDEDALFYSTLISYDNPEENTNDLIGVMTFVCSDPFKYSLERTITVDTETTENVDGHTSTSWRTKTIFTEAQTDYELKFNAPGKSDLRDITKIKVNHNFVIGDELEVIFDKRKVLLNNRDITNSLVILESNFKELPINDVELEASFKTEVIYHERYY